MNNTDTALWLDFREKLWIAWNAEQNRLQRTFVSRLPIAPRAIWEIPRELSDILEVIG